MDLLKYMRTLGRGIPRPVPMDRTRTAGEDAV